MDKKKVIKYVIITYAIAWALQIAGALYMVNNPGMTGQMVFKGSMAVCMFAPLAAALLVKADFRSMGWKPKFKGNIGWLFFCAYASTIPTVLGAALFYGIFPNLLDTSGSYLIAQGEAMGVDIEEQLANTGLTIQTYMLTSLAACIYAPFLNIITAIGEEVGWRGFLYPELNKSFGKIGTWLIGGTIWGAFHFPSIIFGGYEYGFDYLGKPVLGLIAFTITCIALGVLEEIVYSRTKSIWYAALMHGSVNCIGTLPLMLLNVNDPTVDKYMILGPYMNGLIAGIPLIIIAAIMGAIAIRKQKAKEVSV
ncbi:MAG: CPBP family intramembrane metalloprotease [Clostridiales bacterium]|nr:CPBP family intramembrane metalloprotease [Clostridiales bacterium]